MQSALMYNEKVIFDLHKNLNAVLHKIGIINLGTARQA